MSAGESYPLLPVLNSQRVSVKNKLCTFFRQTALLCSPFCYLGVLMLCLFALIIHPTILSIADQWFTVSSSPSMHKKRTAIQYLSTGASSDLISDLPGFDSSSTYLSSITQYSGYVDALNDRQLHYWFIESKRVLNGESVTDIPLFFWTNGGPGCSGLLGLLSEQGPFWAKNAAGDLMENPFSWHTEVHIVFFEQPYGVGFSTVDTDKSIIIGDNAAALDFDAGIRSFLLKFPELSKNEIYLSAESFGGHYMPLTSLKILENNELGNTPFINFKGFMVGNPYTNSYENTFGMIEAWYGHGLMREDFYEIWRDECWDNYLAIDKHFICTKIYMHTYDKVDNYIDPYALDFEDCSTSWSSIKSKHSTINKNEKQLMLHKIIDHKIQNILNTYKTNNEWNTMLTNKYEGDIHKKVKINIDILFAKRFPNRESMVTYKTTFSKMKIGTNRRLLPTGYPYIACASTYLADYLNMASVQTALHIKDIPVSWSMCNYAIFDAWPDSDWDNAMQKYYQQLVTEYRGKLKIMIYSGDDDSVCGIHGTQYWLDRMKGWIVDDEQKWQAYEYNEQLAGYLTHYVSEDSGESLLYFHSIHSAGHMVPQTQPGRALAVLRRYLYEFN